MKKNTQKSNAAKMSALANQVKQLQAKADAGKLSPAKVKKSNAKGRTKERKMAAATFQDGACRVGLKDLVAHSVSWVAGDVYVGNGTLGLTDAVFFRTVSGTNSLVQGAGGFQVPILAADENIGAGYVSDIEKHYARKVVRSLKVRLVSLIPSTANSCMVAVAPVRGMGASCDAICTTGAGAGASLQNTLGMAGAKSMASYESSVLDLTPYIAGGFGARQNEFNINADGEAPTIWGAGTMDLTGLTPAAFVISGQNSTTALRGLATHYIVIEQIVDYLDFLAGVINVNASALALKRDDALWLLKLIMTSNQKNPTDLELTKRLVKFVGKDSY